MHIGGVSIPYIGDNISFSITLIQRRPPPSNGGWQPYSKNYGTLLGRTLEMLKQHHPQRTGHCGCGQNMQRHLTAVCKRLGIPTIKCSYSRNPNLSFNPSLQLFKLSVNANKTISITLQSGWTCSKE